MILIKDRHLSSVYDSSGQVVGNMILIKDRHIMSPIPLCTFFAIGKYDTYKGSTLKWIDHICKCCIGEI